MVWGEKRRAIARELYLYRLVISAHRDHQVLKGGRRRVAT